MTPTLLTASMVKLEIGFKGNPSGSAIMAYPRCPDKMVDMRCAPSGRWRYEYCFGKYFIHLWGLPR